LPLPEGLKPFTVSAITTAVKARLEEFFVSVWVSGEVSNFVRASSGHLYFTLKDPNSQLRCVMLRGFALRLKFDPRDGMAVLVRGELTVYHPRGEYQLTVEELLPKGIGSAELALRELKEKLLAKGYFDPKHKRELPRYPKRLALIASATGAALRDMLELLAQRWPLTQVVVYPSRVQGDGAAENVAANLRFLSDLHDRRVLPLDAIVVARGGGSIEDLWAFNEEVVADAIYECSVPVVSAVGHETDVTLADLVADKRAETPSAAIMKLVPNSRDMLSLLSDANARLTEVISSRLRLEKERVDQLAGRPAFRKPFDRVRELEQRLDDHLARLNRAIRADLKRQREKVAATAEQLDALSPLSVLKRGYSLTRRGDGVVVRNTTDVQQGEVILTRLANGEVTSRVMTTNTEIPT
jgi:exodeoxyribonuclease VII large subunit